MNILLVTTWGIACGIAEHSAMLKEAVEHADPEIRIIPDADALDPGHHSAAALRHDPADTQPEIVHLNYHAALHSRWMVDSVENLQAAGRKVVITYHDTMAGTPEQRNSDRCRALAQVADAFIVHEPVADIDNAIYWRQGVPDPEAPWQWDTEGRPIVGTCGFDFPWKNYELLARSSYEAGWAVAFIGGDITEDRQKVLEGCNPHAQFSYSGSTGIRGGFLDRHTVISMLAGCDATAFLYLNANTGTSGAIRMGIAARRPLLATDPDVCRQFRDLANVELSTGSGITWLDDLSPPAVTTALACVSSEVHRIERLAEQDSWQRLGQKYSALYRSLAT